MIDHVPYEDQLILATKPRTLKEDRISVGDVLKIRDVFWSKDMKKKCYPGNYDECYVEVEPYHEHYRGILPRFYMDYALYKKSRNAYLHENGLLDKNLAIVTVWDMDIHSVQIVSRTESRQALILARTQSETVEDYIAERYYDEDSDSMPEESEWEEIVNRLYYDSLWGDAHKTLIELSEIK